MKRRELLLAFPGTLALAACGGGGGDQEDTAFPAYNHGGTIALGESNITVSFDLSRGRLQGLATENPTRVITPSEAKEVRFISELQGWEASEVHAPFTANGVVVLPGAARSDKGYFSVVLKTGEVIPFAISRDASRWAFTGKPITVTSDGALQYGNYRLGRITAVGADTYRVHFGADVLGGLSATPKASDVEYAQWESERTGWNNTSPVRGALQTEAGTGDYFFELSGLPNNDRGNITLRLKNGSTVWFNPKSPRWESLGGLALVEYTNGDVALQHGNYRLGQIAFVTDQTLRVHFGANVLGGLSARPMPGDVLDARWESALVGWDNTSTVRGVLQIEASTGDLYVDLSGMPNNDRGSIVFRLKIGQDVWLNPRSPLWTPANLGGLNFL